MGNEGTKSGLNLPLKLAIVASRVAQGEIAHRAGIREIRFSKIVTGRTVPSPEERKSIAAVLDKSVDDLFVAEAVAS